MGKQWTEQNLSIPPIELIRILRDELRRGVFDRKTWDHAHADRRQGFSNKQVKILGAILLDDPNCSMEEAWDAVLEVAV